MAIAHIPGVTGSAGSPDDARLVKFALWWEPFGGGDEYIFPEFGVDPVAYYRRLLNLLQSARAPRLERGDRQRLVALCAHKLRTLSCTRAPQGDHTETGTGQGQNP
ncbi:hypothetical protein RW1_009_00360 [Rhodococcus wratislaviensis NBRC 100605]|uniref:DUF3263 domain-containing protein n=1 Tax=Rhodococcus wratislaviensis NBRC 100605 TaxID=1219028 RepID=X0PYV2_RHOWR|nr:hypothetical protein RW1_009_00360 [Rhodococcus wratislaviensis NBRC 100605]